MIFTTPLETLSIKELNTSFKNNILVLDNNLKSIILKNSFTQKELLTFKMMTKEEIANFMLPAVSKVCKYLIYKEIKNYNLSSEIYNSIKYRYLSVNIDIENEKIKQIDYFIKKFEETNYLKEKVFKNSKIIYSLDQNIDFLNINPVYIQVKQRQVNTNININEFNDIEEEIINVLEEISSLVYNNKDLQNIKIYMPNNYISYFKILANYYNIPINIDSTYKIVSEIQTQDFVKFVKKNGIKEAIQNIDELIKNSDIKLALINFLNMYTNVLEEEEFLQYFLKEINTIKVQNISYSESLELFNIKNFEFNDKNFNFILGYNNIDFIKYKKDKYFLSDNIKSKINLPTTTEENQKIEKNILNILNFISHNGNYAISYSKYIGKKVYSCNEIIKNKIVIKKDISQIKTKFSSSIDSYLYKKELNKKENYNIITNIYTTLNDNLSIEQKKTFKFKTSPITSWNIDNFKNSKNISSTLIENYYRCNFLFYIENVLGLKQYPKNVLSLHIGTYLHQILDDIINENMQNKYGEKELKELIRSNSQKFIKNNENVFSSISKYKKEYIISKMNNYLFTLINIIIEQLDVEKFNILKTEEEIAFEYKGYNFVGKIDKVLNDDNNNFMVIDYKSGNSDLDFNDTLLENGVNLQNIIYFILLKHKYDKVNFAGTYRYKIVPKISKNSIDKDLKRYGYTNPSVDVISKINVNNYKNLALKSNGDFYAYSKLLDNDQFNKKVEIVTSAINNFITNIEENKLFVANPLKYKEKDSCKYCPYINVCYRDKNSANIIVS